MSSETNEDVDETMPHSPRRSSRVVQPKRFGDEITESSTPTKRGKKAAKGVNGRGKKLKVAPPMPQAAVNWVQCGIPSCLKWRIVSEYQAGQFTNPRVKVTCNLMGSDCTADDDELLFPTIETQTKRTLELNAAPIPAAPATNTAVVSVSEKVEIPSPQEPPKEVEEGLPETLTISDITPAVQSEPPETEEPLPEETMPVIEEPETAVDTPVAPVMPQEDVAVPAEAPKPTNNPFQLQPPPTSQ